MDHENSGAMPNFEATAISDPQTRSPRDWLIDKAVSTDIFRTFDGRAYADIWIDGRRQTLLIAGDGFRGWLYREYRSARGGYPSAEAMNAAIDTATAKARFEGPEREVFVRVARQGECIYIDLADSERRVIMVGPNGWGLAENPPVRFVRPNGMQPLPMPQRGGSIWTLKGLLNVQSDADFAMVVGWLLACLRGCGPYPVLAFSGEHGATKSTASEMIKKLIDPHVVPLRGLPRSERDLCIAANTTHVLSFDNVSTVPDWLSDALCRVATKGGTSVRQNYTDRGEVLFDVCNPIIVNGIDDVIGRPDLADRSFFIALKPIPDEQRKAKEEMWRAFEDEHPGMLGALLDAMVTGLNRMSEIECPALPRMADAAKWVIACETAIWQEGRFLRAYSSNRSEARANALEADPVASAVRALMQPRTEWTGTATQLLAALAKLNGPHPRMLGWPASANALSGRLRKIAPLLREVGISVTRDRDGHAGNRLMHLTKTEIKSPEPDSCPSSPGPTPDGVANPGQPSSKPADDADAADDTSATPPADTSELSTGWRMRI